MSIKKLEKATKILEKIKILDAEIIEIDKFAMFAANDEIKASFELKIDNIGKKKEDENKVEFDSDGSLKSGATDFYAEMIRKYTSPLSFPFLTPMGNSTSDKKNEYALRADISENTTLNILGLLLCDKQRKRDLLIGELAKYGFQI